MEGIPRRDTLPVPQTVHLRIIFQNFTYGFVSAPFYYLFYLFLGVRFRLRFSSVPVCFDSAVQLDACCVTFATPKTPNVLAILSSFFFFLPFIASVIGEILNGDVFSTVRKINKSTRTKACSSDQVRNNRVRSKTQGQRLKRS